MAQIQCVTKETIEEARQLLLSEIFGEQTDGRFVKRNAIKQLLGPLIAARNNGLSFEEIVKVFEKARLDMSPTTLRTYYYDLKTEQELARDAQRYAEKLSKAKIAIDRKFLEMHNAHGQAVAMRYANMHFAEPTLYTALAQPQDENNAQVQEEALTADKLTAEAKAIAIANANAKRDAQAKRDAKAKAAADAKATAERIGARMPPLHPNQKTAFPGTPVSTTQSTTSAAMATATHPVPKSPQPRSDQRVAELVEPSRHQPPVVVELASQKTAFPGTPESTPQDALTIDELETASIATQERTTLEEDVIVKEGKVFYVSGKAFQGYLGKKQIFFLRTVGKLIAPTIGATSKDFVIMPLKI
jgi:hypothetical protein